MSIVIEYFGRHYLQLCILINIYFVMLFLLGLIRFFKIIQVPMYVAIMYLGTLYIDRMGTSLIILTNINFALAIKAKFKTLNVFLKENENVTRVPSKTPLVLELYNEILEALTTCDQIFGMVLFVNFIHDFTTGAHAAYLFLSLIKEATYYPMFGVGLWTLQSFIKMSCTILFLESTVSEV